jgi:hypothetical protein
MAVRCCALIIYWRFIYGRLGLRSPRQPIPSSCRQMQIEYFEIGHDCCFSGIYKSTIIIPKVQYLKMGVMSADKHGRRVQKHSYF